MKNLLNPRWLFLINTLPISILIFIFLGEFTIVKSLLKEENIKLWKTFGFTLISLAISTLVYAIYSISKAKKVSPIYGLISLAAFIPFLYLYGNYAERIIPSFIPQWMIPSNMILYVGTFIMPTLAYSLFILVVYFTPENKDQKAWKSFSAALIIPISFFLFTQLLMPLFRKVELNFNIHFIIVFVITCTVAFLFFLIRSIYIFGLKKAQGWAKYQLAWKIPISLVFPLLGLAVNNGKMFNNFGVHESGVFGDFNSIWFYILAAINGIFICLPNLSNHLYRIFLFIGRSVLFVYTLYFFLVFLPFLPLSVVAIIAVGTGFLMLTPLVLLIIHIQELSQDFRLLRKKYPRFILLIIGAFGFLTIPIFITGYYLNDRKVLNQTLEYLYTPDYSKDYNINTASLNTTLQAIKSHKDEDRDLILGHQIPYLSSYFNWIVLDNLTLSDTKINTIERIFFGNTSFDLEENEPQKDSVNITKIKTTSTFDKNNNSWKSWVDLEITNQVKDPWNVEYNTTIDLPTGCWISNYYLYVGKRKEMGILAEKKSAMWVFSNIRNENKDPGILHYLTGNKVAFRVFPFANKETRKTGIEFIHQQPLKIKIDNNWIDLGNSIDQFPLASVDTSNGQVAYIPSYLKKTLPVVNRKPYYYFIVDASLEMKNNREIFINRIEKVLKNNQIDKNLTKICFTNAYTKTHSINENWKLKYFHQNFEGSFYLDRAIKKILVEAYKNSDNIYPIIITVTDQLTKAIVNKDFSDLQFCYPENNLFYNLNKNGELIPHSLVSNPLQPVNNSSQVNFNDSVFAFTFKNKIHYLPINNEPSIVYATQPLNNPNYEASNNFQSGLYLQGQWVSQILYPQTSNDEWIHLVKNSFKSKIMSPVTAYLVVENEAQKAMLLKKQQQVLSSNKSLDLGEDTQRMSEPGLIFLGILLIIWAAIKHRKKISLQLLLQNSFTQNK